MNYRYDVFLSYNHAQSAWIRRLVKRLREHRVRVFFDQEVGLAGTALSREIAAGLLASRSCVIVLTPESVESKWVGLEIQKALHMDPDSMRRFVIPLLLKDCTVPPEIDHIGYIDCRNGLTSARFDELVKAIAQRGAARFVGSIQPSEAWTWGYAPANVNLAEIAFVDDSRGWLVGDQGRIFETTNGGRTWTTPNVATTQDLYSIAFAGRDDGWIVGARSTVLRSTDRGGTWHIIRCPVNEDLLAVASCEEDRAVCVVTSGGRILRRQLNAKLWTEVAYPRVGLWSIDFSADGSLGCAVGGNGTICISRDAGRSWQRKRTRISSPFYSASVLPDRKSVCVVGDEGRILISRDGGQRWHDHSVRTKLWESWLNAADFSADGSNGWAVGTKGQMLKTVDGGESWVPYALDEAPELVNVQYAPAGTLWVVGQTGMLLTTQPR